MAFKARAFAPAVVLATTTSFNGLTIVINDGVGDFTFNITVPSAVAGVYSAHGWAAHFARLIRQYIKDRCDATAGIIVKPVLANIDVSLGWPQASPINVVAGVNLSPLRFHIGSLGGAASINGPCVIKSVQLNNASNHIYSLWGLTESEETRLMNAASGEVSGGVLNADGRFQPRFFYACSAHFTDDGNQESLDGAFGDDHADGDATYYEFGETSVERIITLVALQRQQTGPMYKVGLFSSFGATRNIINLSSADETLLNGMTGTYKRTDQLALGQYIRVGKSIYPLRFKQVSADTFVTYEPMPASVVPTAGTPIYVVSELHALTLEWRRTGLLLAYDPIDASGLTSWMGDFYVPARQGEWKFRHDRAARIPLYSYTVAGKLCMNPVLSAP